MKRGIAGALTTTDIAFPCYVLSLYVLFQAINMHSNDKFMNVKRSWLSDSTQSLLRQTATSGALWVIEADSPVLNKPLLSSGVM